MIQRKDHLKQYAEKYPYIFLYGIHENSRILYRALRYCGIKVSCFVAEYTTEKIYGKKVIPLKKLKKYAKKSLILIDELSYSEHIKKEIEEKGFFVEVIHRRLFWALSGELMRKLEQRGYPALRKNADKKILFLASDNNRSSGAFLCLAELNERLNQDYHIETLVVLPWPGSGEEILQEKNIKYTFIRSHDWTVEIDAPINMKTKLIEARSLAINARAIAELKNIIEKEKFDLLHINTIYSYVGAKAALITNTKLIWHIREVLELNGNRKIQHEDRGYALINKADRILTVSEGVGAQYPCLDRAKVKTIYDGVRKDVFYHAEKQIFQKQKLTFLIVGSVQPHKGQKELIDACAMLSGNNSIELWIVGGGEELYLLELKQMVQKYKMDVVFWGAKNDVGLFYQKADVCFCCSQFEAFGRVTVEAMLSGCLVIGADTGATKEIIQDCKTGYLYHQGNAQALAEKIGYVLEHKEEAKKAAKAGQQYAVDHFTVEKNAADIVDIYREILE